MARPRIFLWRIGITAVALLAGMTAYETAKQLLFPDIGIWESHIVTIVFTATLGTALAYFAFRRIDDANLLLERRVAARTEELSAANAELETFVYSISHDLRAPLRAMSSFASLLAGRPAVVADAQAAEHAQRIARAAARMGELVAGLVSYARLARQPLEVRPVALRRELDAVLDGIGVDAGERPVRWQIGELPEVRGEAALLRVVLGVLVENAVKFTRTREAAAIEVFSREREGEVEIAVRDNGVGFDMAHATQLFRPFQRLHNESEFEGTGIGLAHAKRIVERHGGRIWAEAAPGQGATFRFTLPKAA